MPASTSEIIEPGLYDYELTVKFPSVYIPEHTPPQFRNSAAMETTRTRWISGQFNLTERVAREAIRDHFVRQSCEDVDLCLVDVTRFDLTLVTS
ncbi:hypothetical protein ACFVZH_02620 [Streptomyces sp. NPDC059534]|uniref:hypothetical protein n=1 Tax=Streptomyces sp. NPDC059534 TaxID=3346859 RepID=UPI003679B24D